MQSTSPELDAVTIFRALSDQTRLRILNLLQGGEMCVCDLVDILDVPQPTASRHLAYLRKAELVLDRKKGQWRYYRLSPTTNDFHKKVLECITACEKMTPILARDSQRLQLKGCRNCCD